MTENEAKLKLLIAKSSKKATAELANKVSEQILSGLKTNNKELHNIFAELTVEIAALCRRMDNANKAPVTDFDKSFAMLAESLDKDVVASLSDEQVTGLAAKIGETLSNVVSSLNLEQVKLANDTVEIKGLDKMLEKLVKQIPDKIDGKVTLAYNRAAAKDYINVRLTNGDAFIDSIVAATGGRGPGLPLIKTDTNVMALPVVNPDGSYIGGTGGSSGGLTDDELRAAPVPVDTELDLSTLATKAKQDDIITAINNSVAKTANNVKMAYKTGDSNIIYIGEAVNGTTTTFSGWKITRLDTTTLLDVTYADGNLNYDNKWSDRETLSYS